ncbi:MAG: hypothetical protein RLZZ24_789 [Pseudomonadota bacterium]
MSNRPSVQVAVFMRKERVQGAMSRWQTWRWLPHGVHLQDENTPTQARVWRQSEDEEIWLHPGFTVSLFKDDVQGYYLNSTSPTPSWFVLWRMEEEPQFAEDVIAVPTMVSLSYHDAGRWLDAQENVDPIAAPDDVVAWMNQFTQTHWQEEPKRRKRPESFKPLHDRFGNPASVSTDKPRGGGPKGPHV